MASQQDDPTITKPPASEELQADSNTDSAIELSHPPSPAESSQPAKKRPAEPPTPKRQLSISDPNIHVCFICLLNSTETPDATWVNACPCTLEAHEGCMLRWVSETEMSASRSKKKLRCPACNGRIRVVEPWDPVVKFRERFHRAYSKASPVVLFSIFGGMSVAATGSYALASMMVFAGSRTTLRWLGIQQALEQSRVSVWVSVVGKFCLLSIAPPALLFNKILPSIGNLVFVPTSIMYAVSLAWRDHMPTWPLSPEWVMTLMPYISIAYSGVYYNFFGSLERRLNRALRGRPLSEEEQAPAAAAAVPAAAPAPVVQQNQAQADGGDIGIGTALWRLGSAVVDLLEGDDAGEEDAVGLEVDIELAIRDGDEAPRQQGDQDLVAAAPVAEVLLEEAQVHGIVDEPADDADLAATTGAQPMAGDGSDAAVAVAAAAAVVDHPADPQPAANPDENENEPADEVRGGSTTLSDVVNGLVTQLLFPVFSAGIGELLSLALPRSWVSRDPTRRPGLLQERWGRSLVGGCLFIVLKDAFNLYGKYRRVEVKSRRKVRNVERRRGGEAGGSTS